jgi:hypothetical protein
VKNTVHNGEVIKSYEDDKPFPSYLVLGNIKEKALHVVVAHDEQTATLTVITAYLPSLSLWEKDFKNKKTI